MRRVRHPLQAQALAERVAGRPSADASCPARASRRARAVIGAVRGAGGRGARRSRRASRAGVTRPLLGLHGVAAELVAERGQHLGPVALVLAGAEAGLQARA